MLNHRLPEPDANGSAPAPLRVTADHVARYRAEGCVAIEGAFDAGWVERLTRAFDRMMGRIRAGDTAPANIPGLNVYGFDGDHWDDTGRRHLRNGVPHDPDLWAWAVESPAAEIVGRVLESDFVQFWYDLWFEKSGATDGSATQWHHDATGHVFVGPDIPSLWVALSDIGPEDAPLMTFAGSHLRDEKFPPPYRPGKEDWPLPGDYLLLEELEAIVAAHPEAVRTWTLRAGDCLVIHPATWHGAPPYRGRPEGRRLAITSRWIGRQLRYDPPYFAEGASYYPEANALPRGARPPFDFLPVLWRDPALPAG